MHISFSALALAMAYMPFSLATGASDVSASSSKQESKRAPAIKGRLPRDHVFSRATDEAYIFDVYMHVLARPEEAKEGQKEFLVTPAAINKYMDFMNKKFEPARISFKLIETQYKVMPENTIAAMNPSDPIMSVQEIRDLYRGDLKTLNIFMVNGDENYGGVTTSDVDSALTRAVFVNSNVMPGGSHPKWNQGMVVLHEVGHWLGIDPHTATSQCTISNDITTKECDTDPNCWNPMSYSKDYCRSDWNPEQISFFRYFAKNLKADKVPLKWSLYKKEQDPESKPLKTAEFQSFSYQKKGYQMCNWYVPNGENKWGVSQKLCTQWFNDCLAELKKQGLPKLGPFDKCVEAKAAARDDVASKIVFPEE